MEVDFPGCPVVKTSNAGDVDSILVRELRSHMLHGVAKEINKLWRKEKSIPGGQGPLTREIICHFPWGVVTNEGWEERTDGFRQSILIEVNRYQIP